MSKKENITAVEPEVAATVSKNKRMRKILAVSGVGVAAIVIGVLVYIYGFRNPAIEKDRRAIENADLVALTTMDDSTQVATYDKVAAENKYKGGNRAKYESAIRLYAMGDYEGALDRISGYKAEDDVVGSLSYTLKGDCLVQLDRLEDAVSAFEKAVSQSDNHPQLAPYNLTKKAVVLSALGKHAEAADIYKAIAKDYPHYAEMSNNEARMLQEEGLASI